MNTVAKKQINTDDIATIGYCMRNFTLCNILQTLSKGQWSKMKIPDEDMIFMGMFLFFLMKSG